MTKPNKHATDSDKGSLGKHNDAKHNDANHNDAKHNDAKHNDANHLLTTEERGVEPPELESEDDAEQASIDSFPASDPPSYTPAHAGNLTQVPVPRNPGKSNGPNQKR